MDELKRFLKTVWHITLASLATYLVYFPLAYVLKAAENDRIDDGSFFWTPVIIFLICELCFLVILWWMHFHQNDELENEFMKEYRDEPWQGKKEDFSRALKSEALAYVFVFAVGAVTCGMSMMSIQNPLVLIYFPFTMLQVYLHPVLGCVINLAVFAGGYTLTTCFVREKLAVAARSSSHGSTYGTNAYIQSRRSIHKK